MVVISTYSNREFYFNGTRYLRNYISRVSGTKVAIFNCYENADVLVEPLEFDQFNIEGETFADANEVQAALNQIIYSRGTLGNDVPELVQDNKFKAVDVEIDIEDDVIDIADKINALAAYNVTEFENVVYIAQTPSGESPSRYAVLIAKGQGKGTYGSGATQITAGNFVFLSDGISGTPAIDQDNISIFRTILIDGTDYTVAQLVTAINTGPAFTITEKQIYWIAAYAKTPNEVGFGFTLTKGRNWKIINKGKGLYGTGGVAITAADLRYNGDAVFSATDIADDPSTQIIDYGALTGQTVEDWLNEQTPAITIQGQEAGYVLFTGSVDGTGVDYLFTGAAGDYGLGEDQATAEDFQAIPQEVTPPPASGQIKILFNPGTLGVYQSNTLIGRSINAILANGVMYDDFSLPAEYVFEPALGRISGIEGIADANIVVFYS